MYRHTIPANILDNGNLAGGFLKKRNTIEAVVIIVGMALLFKVTLFAVSMLVKTILFIVFAVFPAILAVLGIGDESLSEALGTYLNYRKTKDILAFNLAEMFPSEEEPEEEEDAGKGKKKRKKEKKKEPEKKLTRQEKKAIKLQQKYEKKAAKLEKKSKK